MTIPETTPCFVALANRGRIRISGCDAFRFLQNLITNDLGKLQHDTLLHSCLLTAQGKFLHDFFISKSGADYFLDCEGGERLADLARRLKFYRLRLSVDIQAMDAAIVYAVFDNGSDFLDPRCAGLGRRVLCAPDLPEQDHAFWDKRRIRHAVADGSRDAEIEKSTLAELNMDQTSIDYGKGCYIGQELTARIHHRGLSKKHLTPVAFDTDAPLRGTALYQENSYIGEMRSSCGNTGLALLKNGHDLPVVDGFVRSAHIGIPEPL